MITADSICSALKAGVFNNEDLETIAQALRYSRTQLGKRKALTLRPGDAVKFTDPRRGTVYSGKVIKVKIKYVSVNTLQGIFNVPANLLEIV